MNLMLLVAAIVLVFAMVSTGLVYWSEATHGEDEESLRPGERSGLLAHVEGARQREEDVEQEQLFEGWEGFPEPLDRVDTTITVLASMMKNDASRVHRDLERMVAARGTSEEGRLEDAVAERLQTIRETLEQLQEGIEQRRSGGSEPPSSQAEQSMQ